MKKRQKSKKPKRVVVERKFVKPTNFTTFIDDDIDIDNRIIHLFEDIDADSASKITKGIQIMIAKDKNKPIDIYINTFGGCAYSGLFLYDFIRCQRETEIRTYACGCVMSAGSLVFFAGDERYMYENSVIMLHSVASMAEGKVFLELNNETEECKKIYKQLCNIYAENTKPNYKEWYRWLKFEDKNYRKDKALELGFVNKILKP